MKGHIMMDAAKLIHYPECWDTAAYPTLHDALHEILNPCPTCGRDRI